MDPLPLPVIIEKAGGVAELARKLDISSQAVSQWRRVPAERLLAVASIAGIPAHELRPDICPAPPASSDGQAAADPSSNGQGTVV